MPCLLVFSGSDENAQGIRSVCAASGWDFRTGACANDLDGLLQDGSVDGVLVDFVCPIQESHRLVQFVAEQAPFMPMVFLSEETGPREEFGDGLRYYMVPAHINDLEHILISLTCGFPSGNVVTPTARPERNGVPRVLIVDDNIELANLIERSLRALERFDVRVTGSGFEAASILPAFHPDVVVVDLVLDDMDGREVCSFIRNHDRLQQTRIIGVSGYLPEDCATTRQDLFDVFLEKPFRVKDVVDQIVRLAEK